MSDRNARTIAAGGNPPWEATFKHPVHGELTFKARLPLAVDSLKHSVAVDNRLQELDGAPSLQTAILSAALAGMVAPDPDAPGKGLLMELPPVSRDEDDDPERGSVRVVTRYYDPETEASMDFLSEVWLAYSRWRQQQLSDETVRAVGKSSGAPSTPSDGSSTPSAAATEPPAPTPAS